MNNPKCPNCGNAMNFTHTEHGYITEQEWRYTEDDRYLEDVKIRVQEDHFKCPHCQKRYFWGYTSYYDGFIPV